MQTEIITIYCLCVEYLTAIGHRDDGQATLSTAEVMTVALVAARYFKGCLESSRQFLVEHGDMRQMLSKSRLNRRLHAISEGSWLGLFALLAEAAKRLNPDQEYIVDSLPVPVCDNIRISRCHLYRDEAFRGYIASKRRYFYGLRVHMLITTPGVPVEFTVTPGAIADLTAFKTLPLDLPEHATIYADRAYNDYGWEDLLADADCHLVAHRRKDSKRPHPPWLMYLCLHIRKRVETTFSSIAERRPKCIRAVTPRGFELKVFLFVLAFAICG
jgi:hypothetical protein